MRTHGVDVSHWEGAIDWAEAARWVPFAYFKCTDGVGLFDNTYQPIGEAARQLACPSLPITTSNLPMIRKHKPSSSSRRPVIIVDLTSLTSRSQALAYLKSITAS